MVACFLLGGMRRSLTVGLLDVLDTLVVVRDDAHVRGVPDLGQIGGVTLRQ